MPVTVRPVAHAAAEWDQAKVSSSESLLEQACPKLYRRSNGVVQSSFDGPSMETGHVSASENGLVWAAYHAYSNHHHLVVRPEDVWFAILTQVSFFVNAHAEELRDFFVDHDGKKDLEAISNVRDFGALAIQMADLIGMNVKDAELRDWVMPAFSTTTHHDRVVGAVLFMGAMQKYFSYGFTILCGLPSVTLLGEVGDWREILARLDKLDRLGSEPSQFAEMLRPVLKHMVMSFEDPKSEEVVHFWNTIVHRNPVGSGTDYLSGWLTAFCFWNEEGKAKMLMASNVLFDGVHYPKVDVDCIPPGCASVPVKVNDNGDVYEATMVAGSVAIRASSLTAAGGEAASPTKDTVQAVSGWWICRSEDPKVAEGRKARLEAIEAEIDMRQKEADGPEDSGEVRAARLETLLALYREADEIRAF